MSLDALREGVCPDCGVPMVREGGEEGGPSPHGRCPRCGIRLSLNGDEVTLHILGDLATWHRLTLDQAEDIVRDVTERPFPTRTPPPETD